MIAALARLLRRTVPRPVQDRDGCVPRPAPQGAWRIANYWAIVASRADRPTQLPVAAIGELVIDGRLRVVGAVGLRGIPCRALAGGNRAFRQDLVAPMAWLHAEMGRSFRAWRNGASPSPLDRFLETIGLDAEHVVPEPVPACLIVAAGDAPELMAAARGYMLATLEKTFILVLTANLEAAAVLDDRSLGWVWLARAEEPR